MRLRDTYTCFAELAKVEKEGVDYRLIADPRPSPVLIIAPHGGKIEYGASQIAGSIAADRYSLYCFEGVKAASNGTLHVTSARFDEPTALAMVRSADLVVSVHGRADDGDEATIEMGGLDADLRQEIERALSAKAFAVNLARPRLRGEDPANICNRGRRNAGAQLEIPSALRMRLVEAPTLLEDFANAVRSAIERRIDVLQLKWPMKS
jgi:phage replication-related protein YjqB (UPF0714/DUF867 family)